MQTTKAFEHSTVEVLAKTKPIPDLDVFGPGYGVDEQQKSQNSDDEKNQQIVKKIEQEREKLVAKHNELVPKADKFEKLL